MVQGLGGLEVDHQLELRGLLHQQVRRLGPLENPIYIGGGLAQLLRPARFIRQETTRVHKLARIVDRWQAMLGHEVHHPLQVPPVYLIQIALPDEQRLRLLVERCGIAPLIVVGFSHLQALQVDAQLVASELHVFPLQPAWLEWGSRTGYWRTPEDSYVRDAWHGLFEQLQSHRLAIPAHGSPPRDVRTRMREARH